MLLLAVRRSYEIGLIDRWSITGENHTSIGKLASGYFFFSAAITSDENEQRVYRTNSVFSSNIPSTTYDGRFRAWL